MGICWSAPEFCDQLIASIEGFGASAAGLPLPDQPTLDRIRAERSALFARWERLPSGETLELPFDPSAFEVG